MRSTYDRFRHAILFELVGVALVTPLGAILFRLPLHDIGIVAAGSAFVAMVWTYLYNLGFDHALQRLTGRSLKRPGERVIHAILFEAGLLAILLPLIAFWLDLSLWQALLMDGAFSLFYVVYALAYNWAYDRLFPLPGWRADRS